MTAPLCAPSEPNMDAKVPNSEGRLVIDSLKAIEIK